MSLVLLFTLSSFKKTPPAAAWLAAVGVGLGYAAAPWFLLRFYNSAKVKLVFGESDHHSMSWLESLPMANLVSVLLMALYAVMMHVPIFFHGLFPLFRTWLSGLRGVFALAASIICLAVLAWGTARGQNWAGWDDLIFFALLTSSAIVTLVKTAYAELLSTAHFPPFEPDILQGMPLRGYHSAIFVGIPLLITLGVVIAARSRFTAPESGGVRPLESG